MGLEGVLAKRKGSHYEPGRSTGPWVKYKIHQAQEFVIGGYTAGNPFDALIVGCYDAGKLKSVGKVRNGFLPHLRCAMVPLLQQRSSATPSRTYPHKNPGFHVVGFVAYPLPYSGSPCTGISRGSS